MPDISYIDSALKKSLYKEISIQLSLNGFSFLINSQDKKCLAFKHFIFRGLFLVDELIRNVSDILRDDNALQNSFSKANITFISQKSTLIPAKYFDTNNAKKYFEFNQSMDELDELHYNKIEELDTYNLFAVPNYLANELSLKFDQNLSYSHQATSFLRNAAVIHKHNPKHHFYVNINKGFFDLAIFDDGKLKLSNSYPYVHQTDFIYFLLYAAKELGYDAHNEAFVFMGEHSNNIHLLDEVRNFIGDMHFINDFISSPVDLKKFPFRELYGLAGV